MPFTLEEMDDFANRYLLIMDPRLIKVVVNERNEASCLCDWHARYQQRDQEIEGIPFAHWNPPDPDWPVDVPNS